MKIKKSVLRNIVRESIEWCIIEGNKNNGTIDAVKTNIQNHIINRFRNANDVDDSDYTEDILAMGINPNYNNDEFNQIKQQYFGKNFEGTLRDKIVEMSKVLHKYVNTRVNQFNFEAMRKDSTLGKNGYSYVELMRMKEFLDSKGLDKLYLNPEEASNFAIDLDTVKNTKNIGDIKKFQKKKGIVYEEEFAWFRLRESFLKNYLDKTYGLGINLPSKVFATGNKKLPNDMLIINFTSALQCPAWNECLIKEACYARQGEKAHSNVRNANTYRNLMWRSSYNDDTLTSLIFQLVRLYCINYTNVLKEIKNNYPDYYRLLVKETGSRAFGKLEEKLSSKQLNEFDENINNILVKNLKVKYIRLNEDGDFIGDWLVRKIDEFAGELNSVGITCSAYTCRNLNSIKNVSNIIINSSNRGLKGEGINRYFIALSEDLFNCYEDTYANKITEEQIIPAPQRLYTATIVKDEDLGIADKLHVGSENGSYYYKCPCNNANGKNINCYNCKLCYTNDNYIPEGSTMYVFVKAHGVAKKRLNTDHIIKNIGVTKEFLNKYYRDKKYNIKEETVLTESEMRSIVRGGLISGINVVSTNCINSIKSHLNELSYNGK